MSFFEILTSTASIFFNFIFFDNQFYMNELFTLSIGYCMLYQNESSYLFDKKYTKYELSKYDTQSKLKICFFLYKCNNIYTYKIEPKHINRIKYIWKKYVENTYQTK